MEEAWLSKAGLRLNAHTCYNLEATACAADLLGPSPLLEAFGVIFGFLGPKWIIFGLGIRLEKYIGVYSYILTTFVF